MDQKFNEFEVWKQVIDRLRSERPHPAEAAQFAIESIAPVLTTNQIDTLQSLDFHEEVKHIREWFARLLVSEPPGESVDAFYFGLFTERVGLLKKTDAPAMYAGGSDCFDPKNSYCEWACDPIWFPKRRYPRVNAFRRLATILPQADLLTSIVADAFVFSLAQDLTSSTEPALVLGQRPWRAIGSGYDSGDAHLVGYITNSGFVTQHPDD